MSILSVRLDPDDERKLELIVAATQSDKSMLVRKLIRDQWLALEAGKSFVERRGGHPAHVLSGTVGGSSRQRRKAEVGDHFESKGRRRKKLS